jgi:plastocyanin
VRLAAFAVAAVAFAVSACSATATATKNPQIAAAPTPTNAEEVVIYNYKFVPVTLTVPVGTTVTWVNHDIAPHTATHHTFGDEGFDSGNLRDTQIFRHRFRKPGTYDYTCTLHPGMRGTIIVQ